MGTPAPRPCPGCWHPASWQRRRRFPNRHVRPSHQPPAWGGNHRGARTFRGARTVPAEPRQLVGKPSTMMPPGQILPRLLLLVLGPAASCSPKPNATRFVCTEPTLTTFPTGLPPTTVAISVEFTALATLQPTTLAGLPQLQELHFSSNRLATLPKALLQPVPTLLILDLTNNLLADLPDGIFTSTSLLQHLVLRENRLQALRHAWFQHLPRLEWLDLAANALTEVPPRVFHPLRSLRSLDLSHNQLTSLAPGTLMGLQALERLNLEGNQLSTLVPTAFAPAPALRLLFLQDNELQALPTGIFLPLRHLQVLDLARNQLRELELPPRSSGPALDLDISGNPWACECQLLALLRRVAPRLVTARDTLCASPPRHRGQEVATVSWAGDKSCEAKGDGQQPSDH